MAPITEIMTTDPTTIDVRDPMSDAVRAIGQYHHLVVTDGDKPVGMLSTSDLASLLTDLDAELDSSFGNYIDDLYTIEDAMTPELLSVPSTATVAEAAAVLSPGGFHSLAVVDDGELVGIVTTTDFVRYIANSADA